MQREWASRISQFASNSCSYFKFFFSWSSNILVFLGRLFLALVANLLVIIMMIGIFAFGLLLCASIILLMYDFFFSNSSGENKSTEFISTISVFIFESLSSIAKYASNFLQSISSNQYAQGILFFTILIIFFNKLLNAGFKGYVGKWEIVFEDMISRTIWAFEPIGIFQGSKDTPEHKSETDEMRERLFSKKSDMPSSSEEE